MPPFVLVSNSGLLQPMPTTLVYIMSKQTATACPLISHSCLIEMRHMSMGLTGVENMAAAREEVTAPDAPAASLTLPPDNEP